jgi:lysophospholipid hydrolase
MLLPGMLGFCVGHGGIMLACGYRQGEEARSLYMVISGRLRLLREEPTNRPPVVVEDEASRGESVGAVWALSGGAYDTTALCVRDSELVRMSKVCCSFTRGTLLPAQVLSGSARKIVLSNPARPK